MEPRPADFINKSDLAFSDISSEEYRTYQWESGFKITIQQPQKLNVSASGGHRVFDAFGVSHYIPAGWVHLWWAAKDGQPNFVR